jgi:hypothetical protein
MGIDPMRYLECTDQVELLVMAALAEKIAESQKQIDQNRAVMIANAIAKSQGG